MGRIEDECAGCEGWAEVDDRYLCNGCADTVDNDPWCVVDAFDGTIVEAGPFTSEQADLHARVHNDSLRHADRGRFRRAEKTARASRGGR